jgi:hypothetical protein
MNDTLRRPVYTPLRIQEIKPAGWLLNQLRIQAAGLSGNLDKFWPDIRDSRWFGGEREGWERAPYWLDGFIPLAWLLDDKDMQARASRYVDTIIRRQHADGWICPDGDGNRARYDVWALFLIAKVLAAYCDAAGDERAQRAVYRLFCSLDRHIDASMLFSWGQARWFEGLIPLYWLYERTGEDWLLRLAHKLRCQGFDWLAFYERWPYAEPDEKGRWSLMSHVVNNAMMLKSGALLWRLTGDSGHLGSARRMAELLDSRHGTAVGVFAGDECLAGRSPIRGTELCAVGEYMYSLEHLMALTGDAFWGDRLERIAYNALPAAFSPDMWSHQYDQQVNQVQCSAQSDSVFGTNDGDSHLFGLEPCFGCCTANLSQPWPKLASSLVMRSRGGLAVAAYAPCRVETSIEGVEVALEVDTEYPFRDRVRLTVRVERPVRFALELRIPAWAEGTEMTIGGETLRPQCGKMAAVTRDWTGCDEISLRFPMKPKLVPRPNNLYAVERGPLVYALSIAERWVRIHEDVPGREFPHCDYEVYPQSPWNYGLVARRNTPDFGLKFLERPIGDKPFSPDGAPVFAEARGKRVDWELVGGSAAPSPGMKWVAEEEERIRLIPYGCTNLRLTEMPVLEE